MKEIWTKGLKIPRFPQLDGDTSTEILVIGGGMAGVLCARELQSRGVECLLVEGRTVGSGITSGTTAVLSTLHDPLCQDLAARFGQEVADCMFWPTGRLWRNTEPWPSGMLAAGRSGPITAMP